MPHLTLVALVLGFSSLLNVPDTPALRVGEKLWGIGIALGVLWITARWIARLRQEVACSQRWLDRLTLLFHLAYVAAMGVVFWPLEFARIASVNAHAASWFAGDDLAVMAMLLLPLMLGWRTMAAPVALETGIAPAVLVWQQARLTFCLPLLPTLGISLTDDLFRLSPLAHFPAARGPMCLLVLIGFVLTLPVLLRHTWNTHRLPAGPARDQISQVLRKYRVQVSEILHWDTQGMMCNAAVSGFLPRLRYLFVTDELLRRLTPLELAAITAHEAAHFRHRHLVQLAASLAAPVLLLANLSQAAESWQLASTVTIPVWGVCCLIAWSVGHRAWARVFEHQADLTACRGDGGLGSVSAAAVTTFADALVAIDAAPRGDWLHPSPRQRVDFLRRMVDSPSSIRCFERKLWAWQAGQLIVALLLAARLIAVS